MTYCCSMEKLGGVEKFHCHACAGNGDNVYLCETTPGAYVMNNLKIPGTNNMYFDTRAEALAALTTVDAEHGLV